MNKQKEERLEELRNIKETAERNHPGYLVTDVVHYNEKVELINEDGEIEEFDLTVVLIQNSETEEEYELYYLNGREVPIIELLKNRELLDNIEKVVDETQIDEDGTGEEQDEKQDKKPKKESLAELEAEKEKEECAEVIGEDEESVKSVAEIVQEEDTKKLESMNHLQEIDADTKVNYYKDMEKALGLKGVQKFVIVYSEDAVQLSESNERNSSRYSMIVVMDDGSMINLDDRLEEVKSEGTNSVEGRIQTDADEQTRVENNPASMYRIKGSNSNEAFSFENGEYGEIKAYYGNMTRTNGTTFVGTQLETNNVWPTSKEIREIATDRAGEDYTDYKKEETEKHLEHGDEEIQLENSDEEVRTVACESPYVPDTEITWEQFSKIMGDRDIKELMEEFFEQYDGDNGQEVLLRMQAEHKEKEAKDLEVPDETFGEDEDGAGGTQGMTMIREGPWDSTKH